MKHVLARVRAALRAQSRRREKIRLIKDATTCGVLSVVGDGVAQRLTRKKNNAKEDERRREYQRRRRRTRRRMRGRSGTEDEDRLLGMEMVSSVLQSWDVRRAMRMGSFGLVFYGPLQHYWYRALFSRFGSASLPHFVSKVALNQLVLGPVVCTAVFAWTLALQKRATEVPDKVKRDLYPTMRRGWCFWVPASSINFWMIPVKYQVMYMSACGIVWNYILSVAAN